MGLSHVCSSSENVVGSLKGTVVGRRAVFLKYDVKDFHRAREHSFITAAVRSCFSNRDERKFVQEALPLILSNQFVSNIFDPDQIVDTVFQVKKGSGIGMKHAGATSDLCFAATVELLFLSEAQDLGIEIYFDDVFVVLEDLIFIKPFKDRFENLAQKHCVVELKSHSLMRISCLHLFVFEGVPASHELSPIPAVHRKDGSTYSVRSRLLPP